MLFKRGMKKKNFLLAINSNNTLYMTAGSNANNPECPVISVVQHSTSTRVMHWVLSSYARDDDQGMLEHCNQVRSSRGIQFSKRNTRRVTNLVEHKRGMRCIYAKLRTQQEKKSMTWQFTPQGILYACTTSTREEEKKNRGHVHRSIHPAEESLLYPLQSFLPLDFFFSHLVHGRWEQERCVVLRLQSILPRQMRI